MCIFFFFFSCFSCRTSVGLLIRVWCGTSGGREMGGVRCAAGVGACLRAQPAHVRWPTMHTGPCCPRHRCCHHLE